jgi:hypothetical protein
MNQTRLTSLLASLTVTGLTASAQTPASAPQATAATPPAAKPAEPSALEDFIAKSKHPVSWFTWGADMRVRNEYFNNAQSLDPNNPLTEQDYFRFRGRLWTSFSPVTNLSANVRLTAEPRNWLRPSSSRAFFNQEGQAWYYGIFDNMNVQWKNIADSPASFTVGRQDYLTFGNDWLMFDGTPNDGSWTTYIDSARFTYEFKEAKTTVNAVGIAQYAAADQWIPILNHQTTYVTDQDEMGAVLNVANKSFSYANLDGFFYYKHDEAIPGGPPKGDNANIYTLGGSVSGQIDEHWKYMFQGAYQFGEKQDRAVSYPKPIVNDFRTMDAFGINARATYQFKDRLNNALSLSYECLSGDDPNTQNDEMFDVLWGRWPRWSELYNIYSYVNETRVGQTANIQRFGPTWTITPLPKLDFSLTYNAMFANQEVPTRATDPRLFTDSGNFRGHYFQTFLKYKFNQHLNGHLWAEFVLPGDFYTYGNLMTFLRAEIMMTY